MPRAERSRHSSASFHPRPDVPSRIRKLRRVVLPTPPGSDAPTDSIELGQPPAVAATGDPSSPVPASGHAALGDTTSELSPGRVDSAPADPARSRRPVVETLSPARYKVQFTASAELRDKLERLAALLRSEVPDGDLAAIIERTVTDKLE